MGVSDISLTAGTRASLLSQQGVSARLDRSQEHLATGKRVNSPLDNPTNYMAALQLKQYAEDLSQIHRGIGETIQAIKTAGNGVSSLMKLLESMKAVVESAGRSSDETLKAQYAHAYDELYTQLNLIASDTFYRGTNLIGDSDASMLRWKPDDLSASLSPTGASPYTLPGAFMGTGYALYEMGVPDVGWVANSDGTRLGAFTADMTAFEDATAAQPGIKVDYVFVIDASNSMATSLPKIHADVAAVVASLQAQGVDGRYAFTKYGDITPSQGGDPPIMAPPFFYTETAAFSTALSGSADSGPGGDPAESGLEAILATLSALSFRPDAEKRMLLITDQKVHTTSDGRSALTTAGTAATVAAAGVRLDIAALSATTQSQLRPLAEATGGRFYKINNNSPLSSDIQMPAASGSAVATSQLVIQTADYEQGVFSVIFDDPANPKVMTAYKAGIGLYHSWLYDGFSAEGTEAALKDIANALELLRSEAVRFGSFADVLTTRDAFTVEMEEVAREGAEKLTNADMDEEATLALLLAIRQKLTATSLTLTSRSFHRLLERLLEGGQGHSSSQQGGLVKGQESTSGAETASP